MQSMSFTQRMAEALRRADEERVEEEVLGGLAGDFARPVLYADIRRQLIEERLATGTGWYGVGDDENVETKKGTTMREEQDGVVSESGSSSADEEDLPQKEKEMGVKEQIKAERESDDREDEVFKGAEADAYGDHQYEGLGASASS